MVNGDADYGVLPLEKSMAGPVLEAQDALVRFSSMDRVREFTQPVHLVLLGLPGATASGIRHLLSHRVALAQCTEWLWAHRLVTVAEAPDTASAARMVSIRRDFTVAAIAATWAAEQYGLIVLAEGIEDHPGSTTRFVVVQRRRARTA